MILNVDAKVVSYMRTKSHDTLTLYLRSTGGGWCGVIQVPEVAYKVPEVLTGFEEYQQDGITVYIQKSALKGADNISFVLRGFWIFKTIGVEGVKYPKI